MRCRVARLAKEQSISATYATIHLLAALIRTTYCNLRNLDVLNIMADEPASIVEFHAEALVVGGGMGGMYALHRLRQEGVQAKLVEAGSYFGGVWHWNRYPGARVDSEVPLYTLTIPEVYMTFDYAERFPGDVELRRYFKHCDEVLDLSKDATFNCTIDGVERDGDLWRCAVKNGGLITCKFLVLCIGSSYKKHYPKFEGLGRFTGQMLHSASFSEEGIQVGGKRVAVVGNGASGKCTTDITSFSLSRLQYRRAAHTRIGQARLQIDGFHPHSNHGSSDATTAIDERDSRCLPNILQNCNDRSQTRSCRQSHLQARETI
jgi:hypothetical protein